MAFVRRTVPTPRRTGLCDVQRLCDTWCLCDIQAPCGMWTLCEARAGPGSRFNVVFYRNVVG